MGRLRHRNCYYDSALSNEFNCPTRDDPNRSCRVLSCLNDWDRLQREMRYFDRAWLIIIIVDKREREAEQTEGGE